MLSHEHEHDTGAGGLTSLAGKVNHLGLSMRRVGEEVSAKLHVVCFL